MELNKFFLNTHKNKKVQIKDDIVFKVKNCAIIGSSQCHSTDLLFQYSYSNAIEDKTVLFIAQKSKLYSKPPKLGLEKEQIDRNALSKIKIK